jgi:multimeric flavodoxin WrbA
MLPACSYGSGELTDVMNEQAARSTSPTEKLVFTRRTSMKVIAFNGSPRKEGNTYQAISIVFDELKKEGIETELIQLGGKQIHGCLACYKCFENKDKKCSIKTDELNDYIDKMLEADGIIIGSPVYFSNVSSEVKALIDRAGLVSRANDDLFKRKVGAAVVAMRRAGGCPTFAAINFFFLIGQMIIPGSTYWNLGIGLKPGDIQKDEEGIETFRNLGKNMAWLLKKIG